MKKAIFLFAFILTLNLSTQAQQVNVPKTEANGDAVQDNSAYKASLKEMMEVSGSAGTFKVAITETIKMLKSQKKEVPESIWNSLEQSFLKSAQEELFDMLLPIYQKHISLPDLKAITAFYLTPAGKRYAEKTPFIMQESMLAGQQWGMKIGAQFVKELNEKGY